MRIALDTNIFIYVLEANEQHYQTARNLLAHIANNTVTGVASTLCLTEVLAGIRPPNSSDSQTAPLFMEGLEHIDYIPIDLEVGIIAGRLRAEYGSILRVPDAVHLASALIAKADIFVTNDRKLLTLKPDGLKIQLLADVL
jgi:predicted nucleic acid-binding protein